MSSHLKWHEITDFTGGLVTTGAGYLVPPVAAQVMTDCYPLPQGGIRAWYSSTSVALTGVGASEKPIAAHVRVGDNATTPSGADYFLLTFLNSDMKMRLYRMDTSAGATSWSTLKTFTAGTGTNPGHCNFTTYTLSAGTNHLYLAHNNAGSTETGIWRIQFSDGALTQLTVSGDFHRNVTVFQDRLLCATSEGGSSRIRFTDVASETFSGFVDIGPADGHGVRWFFPYSPSDMLIGKEAAFYQLQGEITDPEVFRQSTSLNVGISQGTVEIEDGLVVQAVNDGYYVTQNGLTITPMSSTKLKDSDVTAIFSGHESAGFPVYVNGFLITPLGKIWSRAVNAWFQLSEWSTTVPAISAYSRDRYNWHSFHVEYDGSGAFDIEPRESTTRKQTYTWKSAPLRSTDGRQIVVREIQIYCKTYTTGNSIGVTVNGVTRNVTGIGSGAQKVSFLFRTAAEELDIQVVPNSNSASFEAPTIEALRVGTLSGRLTDLR